MGNFPFYSITKYLIGSFQQFEITRYLPVPISNWKMIIEPYDHVTMPINTVQHTVLTRISPGKKIVRQKKH